MSDHPQGLGASQRKVQYPIFGEWTTIVDPDRHLTSGACRSNHRHGAQWESSMGGRQFMHVVSFAIGGFVAMKSWSVPRGYSPLKIAYWIAGEIGWLGRGTTAGNQQPKAYEQ